MKHPLPRAANLAPRVTLLLLAAVLAVPAAFAASREDANRQLFAGCRRRTRRLRCMRVFAPIRCGEQTAPRR